MALKIKLYTYMQYDWVYNTKVHDPICRYRFGKEIMSIHLN